LLAEKAHAGTERNRAAARKMDSLITIPNRSGYIEQAQLTFKSIFLLASKFEL
jgi:hypothetical protein